MSRKSFALNTEPHEAAIGDIVLKFIPEVYGDEFLDAYIQLRDAQKSVGGGGENADPAELRQAMASLRAFLADLMTEESRVLFTRVDVVKGGEVLETFQSWDEAETYAEGVVGGASVVQHLRLPARVLTELMEWVAELYGGGTSNRPTGRSSGSPQPRRTPGTR
ncbi:hypothetical protein SUDANB1_05680 [Streptomyces sp. enrichment culture]|uniref:hypothetical protein n=1 Tax=Streptomyces sp. enrichment culture TaxID=1795815 RepID=UPI003F55733C